MAPKVKSTTITNERVFVAQGLGGQDDNIDLLGHFFEQMRETTVETAHTDDLLTFAVCAPFFGVIMLETEKTVNQNCENNESDSDYSVHEEDAEGEDEHGAVAPSRSTPLPLNIATRFNDAYIDVDSLNNEEKVQLWRRALASDVHDEVENYNPEYEASREPGERSYLVDVQTGDGTAVTVFSPPISPMFQSPQSPGQPHSGGLPFFQEGRSGHSSNTILHNDNTHRGMGVHAVTNTGSSDSREFINWSITSPGAEEHAHGRLSVGGFQDVGSSFGVEPIAYDHHLTRYREAQSVEEDTHFGREGFLDYIEQAFSESEPVPAPVPVPETEADDEEDGSTDEEEDSEEDKEQREAMRQVERFQEQLRLKRIKQYQKNLRRQERRLARQQTATTEPSKETKPIGLVYFHNSQTPEDFLHMGESSMAVYVHEEYRFQHLVCPAINKVVDIAFQNQNCRRLQSIIVENPDKLYLLEAFAKSGFTNEGVRRRGYYSNIFKEWRDVTYCAMLATEWALDITNPDAPRKARLRSVSLWDEVFTRHQHERDELLRLEERSSRLKRVSSSETIKECNMAVDSGASNVPSTASASEAAESEAGVVEMNPKRRKIDRRQSAMRESVMSARSSSVSTRSSQADPSETHWNFDMPSIETAPLSVPSRAGRPVAGSSRVRKASVSASSSSSISLQSFPSSSSSHWVDLDHEREL